MSADEVARLTHEAISKMLDFAEEVWQAGKDGFRCDSIASCRERRTAAEAAIRGLASMASGPASEAQAGWSAGTEDGDGNPLVTVRADELRALAEFAAGPGLSAWRIDGDMVRREVLATRMQVVVANAITASPQAQVAAQGQKAGDDNTLRHKISDLFKIGRDARDNETIIANAKNAMHLVDCLMAVERELFTMMVHDEDGEEGDQIEECSVNSWGSEPAQYVEQVRAAISALATQPPAPVPKCSPTLTECPRCKNIISSVTASLIGLR